MENDKIEIEYEKEKNKIIEEIILREWKFFQNVHNTGGRAECQDNIETFNIMRSSQWEVMNIDILKSYLKDLNNAIKNDRNLVFEKYARMMKYSANDEYLKIEKYLPKLDNEIVEIVEKIVPIYLNWEVEAEKEYPNVMKTGRKLYSKDDTPQVTSVETYLRGELLSYSIETLRLYKKYIDENIEKKINLARKNVENIIRKNGFNSLEEAENMKMSN